MNQASSLRQEGVSTGHVPSLSARSPRVERLQRSMRQSEIDVVVSFKPENTFYLSGFHPVIYSHPLVAIVPAEGEPSLLLHALRDDHAQQSSWIEDIRVYASWGSKKTMGPDWLAALREILREKGVANGAIGIERDYIPIARSEELARVLPDARFVNASPLIEAARNIKDATEIELARKASALADRGMEAGLETLRGGGNEREIVIEAMRAMNEMWASGYPEIEVCDFGSLEGGVHNGLWCWSLMGERVLFNCDNPTMRRAAPGEIALILIWACANGIHAENERGVAVGKLDRERQRAYDAVLTVRERIQGNLRPGMPVKELYNSAKEQYIALGYERNVPGRIGHGMGLGAHERLSLDAYSEEILQAGMIISFEPGLRIPEWGGLQHSDTTLITDNGFEFLTTTERGFIQVDARP